jgi:DNA-binding transcriptional MerR regulator
MLWYAVASPPSWYANPSNEANMRSQTLTPAAVASILDVNVQTVRRWCAAHAAHLSDGASRAPRQLTGRDVEVLKHVASLRAQGLQTDAINEQLATLTFAEVEAPADPPTQPPQQAQDAPQLPAMVVDLLRQEIAAVRLQTDQTARQQRDRVTMLLYGVLIGAVGAIALFWAAYGLLALSQR